MDLRHLELLRELRDRGTLGAVAAATYRTTSAVSQQLRSAERAAGVALVEPVGRGVRLTWAGEAYADGAVEVFEALARVTSRVDAGQGRPAGTVRIGTLPSAGAAILPEVLARYVGSEVVIELEDFDLAESDFAARCLDADIVIAHSMRGDVPRGAEGLLSRVVARERLDVAVPAGHPLAERGAVAAADVVGQPWITVPPGYPFADVVASIEAKTHRSVASVAQVKDNRLVESLVAQGLGVGLLPSLSTPASDRYVLLPLTDVPARRAIVLIARPDRMARRVVGVVAEAIAAVGAALGDDGTVGTSA